MAGALGVRLSGPRAYAGAVSEEPWVNGPCADPDGVSLKRALRIAGRASAMSLLLVTGLAALSLS